MVQVQRSDEIPGESGCELAIHDDLAVVVEHLLVGSAACHDLRHRLGRIATYILKAIGKLDEGECDAAEGVPVLNAQGESSVCSTDGEEKEVLDVSSPEQSSQLSPALVESVRHRGLETDLGIIAERCALKAEACRWAAERQQLTVGAAMSWHDIQERDYELIARANSLGNCYLWMCRPSDSPFAACSQLRELALCFEVLSHAASLVHRVHAERSAVSMLGVKTLQILAKAQSALWVAVATVNDRPDIDQIAVFVWLRKFAADNNVFISRYMSATDPADPGTSREALWRITEIESSLEEKLKKRRQHAKLLGKIRHKVGLIKKEPKDCHGDWKILAHTVVELIASGLPPSNTELRTLLMPILDKVPEVEDLRNCLEPVISEIRRLRSRDSAVTELNPVQRICPEILEVATRLRGRSVVIIGGDRRPDAHRAITEAFGLQELDWIETTPHESLHRFEPHVARTGVAVVVLAIRWASHSFGGVRKFCRRYNVPFVRLTAGYNPNQLAAAIIDQCQWQSDR